MNGAPGTRGVFFPGESHTGLWWLVAGYGFGYGVG